MNKENLSLLREILVQENIGRKFIFNIDLERITLAKEVIRELEVSGALKEATFNKILLSKDVILINALLDNSEAISKLNNYIKSKIKTIVAVNTEKGEHISYINSSYKIVNIDQILKQDKKYNYKVILEEEL